MVPRSYSSKLIALAVGVTANWLDNLLSKHVLPGVSRGRQGIERRINDDGLLAAELCRILNLELGVSLENAAEIARSAIEARIDGGDTRHITSSGLLLLFPIRGIEQRLHQRMLDATESVARVRRGRPPREPERSLQTD